MNLTLLGQMITFAVLVFFIHRFLWGPLTRMMEARSQRIADGLAAAEKGNHELALAQKRAVEMIREAKDKAAEIIALAERRAAAIADEAKVRAREEADRIVQAARGEIEQEVNRAKQDLRRQVADLAVLGASKILEQEIDTRAHAKLVDGVIRQL